MDKYALNFTKDARVIGHLKKGKTDWYANTVFYFGRAYPMNTAIITVTGNRVNFGDGQKLANSPAQFYSKEKKNILKF